MGDRGSRARAAPSGPEDDRAHPRCPVRARGAPQGALQGHAGGLPARGCTAPRALPVHHDVPRHLGDDAARAHVGNARAADDDADLETRPARRLRARVRAPGDRPGDARLRARLRAPRAERGRPGMGRGAPGGCERDARDGARAPRERLREYGVPGRAVHAGDRAAPAAPVWALRPSRPDGGLAPVDLGRCCR